MTPSSTVAVVMGGPSAEHEISLKSGHGVAQALAARGWRVERLVIPKTLTPEEALEETRRGLIASHADVAFLALHGAFGEDGSVQQLCEDLSIAYPGSGPQASRLGLDKVESRRRFEQADLTVPHWQLVPSTLAATRAAIRAGFSYPLVIKPTNQGSSIGVSLVAADDHVAPAVREAARYDERLLIEGFVQGREVTVGIVEERALPLVEIRPRHAFFDYTAKYTPGQTDYLVPAKLPASTARRVQACGLRAHEAIGCRHLSRVDMILNAKDEPVILEVNTIPGFTATSLLPKAAACLGVSYDELCERLVKLAVSTTRTPMTADQR